MVGSDYKNHHPSQNLKFVLSFGQFHYITYKSENKEKQFAFFRQEATLLNSNLINKITASGKVYSGSYAQFDVTNCKSVTYALTANNGNGSGGNALVIDDTVKAYTKAFDASTLTASGTIDISDATKLQIRCYDNASTFDSGWGGNYTLELN